MVECLERVDGDARHYLHLLKHYVDAMVLDTDFMEKIKGEGQNTVSFTNLYHRTSIPGDVSFFDYIPRPAYDRIYENLVLHLLRKYYDLDKIRLLTFGFSWSHPGCREQEWHFDYAIRTEQIWIPLVDFDDRNGTIWLDVEDRDYYKEKHDWLRQTYMQPWNRSRDLHQEEMKQFTSPYTIRRVQCSRYDLMRLPWWVLHRGPVNEKDEIKTFFFICFTFELEKELRPVNYRLMQYAAYDEF